MITIPTKDKKFSMPSAAALGNIAETFNIDFSTSPGEILISNRSECVFNTPGNVRAITAIATFDDFNTSGVYGYAIVGSSSGLNGSIIKVNNGSNSSSSWAADTHTSTPTNLGNNADMAVFSRNSTMYVTNPDLGVAANSINKLLGASWVTISPPQPVGMMCEFQNRMYFVTALGTAIISMNTSEVFASIGSQYTTTVGATITDIRATQNEIFIFTKSKHGDKGAVYVWNGIDSASATASTGFSQIIPVSSVGALAAVVKDNIPYFFDTNGMLQKYTGSTFQEIARLPIRNKLYTMYCHRNGMTVLNNQIYINCSPAGDVGNRNQSYEYASSGVWCYDESIGLYHTASPSLSTGNMSSITDFGQRRQYVSKAGAIGKYHLTTTNLQGFSQSGALLFGASIFSDNASFAANCLFLQPVGGTSAKNGYIITSQILATGITSTFSPVYIKHSPLWSSNSKLEVKTRSIFKKPVEYQMRLGATTNGKRTISVDDVDSAFHTNWSIGDEVTFTGGYAGGMSAHIVSITGTTQPYVVVLDRDLHSTPNTGSNLIYGQVCNWRSMNKVESVNNKKKQWSQFSTPLSLSDTSSQFKIYAEIESDGYGIGNPNSNSLFTIREIVIGEIPDITK
jgi:hypothetical protein